MEFGPIQTPKGIKKAAISPAQNQQIEKNLEKMSSKERYNLAATSKKPDELRVLFEKYYNSSFIEYRPYPDTLPRHHDIKVALAGNPNTPQDVLKAIAKREYNNSSVTTYGHTHGRESYDVKFPCLVSIAQNPNTPVETLDLLIKHPNKSVKDAAAKHPKMPKSSKAKHGIKNIWQEIKRQIRIFTQYGKK